MGSDLVDGTVRDNRFLGIGSEHAVDIESTLAFASSTMAVASVAAH